MKDENGWYTIDTAPEGDLVLYFPASTGRVSLKEMIIIESNPVSFARKPTHWQPVPLPPVESN